MRTLIIATLLSFTFLNAFSQNDSIVTQNSFFFRDDYFKRITFKIGGGVYLPQGKLQNYLNLSPLLELSLDFPVTNDKSLELAFQFIVPNQNNPFQYIFNKENAQTKSTFIFNPLVRFKKGISKSGSQKILVALGLGASIMTTNAGNLDVFNTIVLVVMKQLPHF